jgi:hypothetical protein
MENSGFITAIIRRVIPPAAAVIACIAIDIKTALIGIFRTTILIVWNPIVVIVGILVVWYAITVSVNTPSYFWVFTPAALAHIVRAGINIIGTRRPVGEVPL